MRRIIEYHIIAGKSSLVLTDIKQTKNSAFYVALDFFNVQHFFKPVVYDFHQPYFIGFYVILKINYFGNIMCYRFNIIHNCSCRNGFINRAVILVCIDDRINGIIHFVKLINCVAGIKAIHICGFRKGREIQSLGKFIK